MMNKLLSAKQVAKLAGVHVNTVLRLARENKIRCVRLNGGTIVRFEKSAVLDWIDRGRDSAGTQMPGIEKEMD